MLTFISYTAEEIKDPFGIISGKRYEVVAELDVPEDDELYEESGVSARVIVKVDGGPPEMVTYDLIETTTGRLLEFDLEEDEEAELAAFCAKHVLDEGSLA